MVRIWAMAVCVLAIATVVAAADPEQELDWNARRAVLERLKWDPPQNVLLDSIMIDGRKITIRAHSTNPNALANFVSNVKSDPLFEEPDIAGITQRSGPQRIYDIDFSFRVKDDAGKPPTS